MTFEGTTALCCEPPGAWRDAEDTPLMVNLPAGEFMMGETEDDKFANDTERPSHRVRISPGLALGRFPVTVEEFQHFRPTHSLDEAREWPVVRVNWHDAHAYCDWLTQRADRAYRLPTEAEWEYACRCGSRSPFSFGNELTPALANFLYDENGTQVGIGQRTRAGKYPANAFGLQDMHGNVCEWVEDSWHPNYFGAPDDGRAWMSAQDADRVIRGGAWDYLPRLLRSSWRDWRRSNQRTDNVGFRVATRDLQMASA
jgi:formylglycine-generating enzyme required for sulfatase activity